MKIKILVLVSLYCTVLNFTMFHFDEDIKLSEIIFYYDIYFIGIYNLVHIENYFKFQSVLQHINYVFLNYTICFTILSLK